MASIEKLDRFLQEINRVELNYDVEKIVTSNSPDGMKVTMSYNDCNLLEGLHLPIFGEMEDIVEEFIIKSEDKFEDLKNDIQTSVFHLDQNTSPRLLEIYLNIARNVENNIIRKENYVKQYYVKHRFNNSQHLFKNLIVENLPDETIKKMINKLYVFHLDLIKQLIDFLKYQIKEIEENPSFQNSEDYSIEKLKWNGSPSQFGWLFLELAKRGFIEIPQTRQQDSYSRFAKVCFEVFDIETTAGNLKNELNPKRNSLTPANRDEFKIPKLEDISRRS